MKKYILFLVFTLPLAAFGQGLAIGVKGGLNFANVTKVSSINNSSRTGFHAGIFLGSNNEKIFGSRTELIFSRQGYNYKSGTNTGTVDLNYLILPQFMAINITKYVQLQIGGQMAFLLNAKVDSAKKTSSTPTTGTPFDNVMDFYNRFDYGFGGGVEIHPVAGLLIGARMNVSLNNIYKVPENGQMPSFSPKETVKNNVFQLFAGWQFGKKKEKKDKTK